MVLKPPSVPTPEDAARLMAPTSRHRNFALVKADTAMASQRRWPPNAAANADRRRPVLSKMRVDVAEGCWSTFAAATTDRRAGNRPPAWFTRYPYRVYI